MKKIVLIVALLSFTLMLPAECFDYQSEIQQVESFLSASVRSLKRAKKADQLEDAQRLVDKSINQAELALTTATFAKEYAQTCSCDEGVTSATNIYSAINDFVNMDKKAAESGTVQELLDAIAKNVSFCETILDQISEASSLCLE